MTDVWPLVKEAGVADMMTVGCVTAASVKVIEASQLGSGEFATDVLVNVTVVVVCPGGIVTNKLALLLVPPIVVMVES
jgi:hypothetical protein